MADKDWKKRLEAIGNTPMDDTSKRIMAGIEASKKRNAELAKDVDKRRAEYEAKQKAAKERPKKPSGAPKRSTVSSATTVRQHKGGGATAEVDTEKVARQTKADAAKKQSQPPKKTSEPRRVLSSSDSEAQKEKAAEGARKTVSKLRRGFKHGKARYDENARIMANRTRLFGALRPGNKQSRRKRGLKIGDD